MGKRLVEGPMSSELSLEQCSKRLVALVAPHRRATLVVDALDECENYKELLCRLIAVAGKRHEIGETVANSLDC